MTSLRRIALTTIPCLAAGAYAQQPVGTLSIVRQVLVANSAEVEGRVYVDARDGQKVLNRSGVRTKRRSHAIINFNDHSQLRVNENTDMEIVDAPTLRNIQLNQGAVWVKVAKGINTEVTTATATATARGTEFEVFSNGDTLVFEGSVVVTIAGKEYLVEAGQKIVVGANGSPVTTSNGGTDTSGAGTGGTSTGGTGTGGTATGGTGTGGTGTGATGTGATGTGGTGTGGTGTGGTGTGGTTTGGTSPGGTGGSTNTPLAVVPLESSEVPIGRGGGNTTWFTDVVADSGITVGTSGSSFTQTRTDPVGDTQKKATRGGLNVVIRSQRQPRATTSIDPRSELGLVDDTNTSDLIPLIALGASVAVDRNNLTPLKLPGVERTLFAYGGDPAFAGVRADVTGLIGQSRYSYEANAIQFYNDPTSNVLGRFDSVSFLDRKVTDNIEIFAGRRKFYHGPVFNDTIDTQLIADRYSAAGFHYSKNALSIEAAYLYDGNRYIAGVQPGALASVFYKLYGGVVGAHFLEADDVPGGGHGSSGSFSMPLVRNVVDGYGEVGTGIDRSENETFGIFLPGFFQKTGVSLFGEYARKRDIAQSYSLTALFDVPKGPQLRGSMEWVNGTPRVSLGAALKF